MRASKTAVVVAGAIVLGICGTGLAVSAATAQDAPSVSGAGPVSPTVSADQLSTPAPAPDPVVPDIDLCLLRAGAFPMGESGLSSAGGARDSALRDLAAVILSQNPDLLASAAPTLTMGVAQSVTLVPADTAVDATALFDTARAALSPVYQDLVSPADLVVTAPATHSFTDLCTTYTAVDGLFTIDGEPAINQLSIDLMTSTISFEALDPLRSELQDAIAGAESYTSITLVDEFSFPVAVAAIA